MWVMYGACAVYFQSNTRLFVDFDFFRVAATLQLNTFTFIDDTFFYALMFLHTLPAYFNFSLPLAYYKY